MDSGSDAASILNAQLDRKITIVNFDLHRLQDDLNEAMPVAHFASAMLKFLPDVDRLAALPAGPRFAFDLLLKLGGNVNSHGGLDNAEPADGAARRDFYARLDDAMVDVVRRRMRQNEDWPVLREVRRIEKTAAYLKTYGIEPYFPTAIDCMRSEADSRAAANGTGPPAATTTAAANGLDTSPAQNHQPAPHSHPQSQAQPQSYTLPQGSPPRYR